MEMTKMYRVVSYVLDLNGNNESIEDVKNTIQNNRYPEFHRVKEVLETDIGPWSDDHQLNKSAATKEQFDAYFAELDAPVGDPWLKQEHQRVRSIMLAQIQKNSTLEQENQRLREEIKKLNKVQEFVQTVKDLTR